MRVPFRSEHSGSERQSYHKTENDVFRDCGPMTFPRYCWLSLVDRRDWRDEFWVNSPVYILRILFG